MSEGQIIYRQFDDESIKNAPDGYYVAHVDHPIELHSAPKVSKQIILAKHGDDLYEPPLGASYRGHVYRIEGPICRVTLCDREA